VDDKECGQGRLFRNDNEYVKGTFVNGLPHGFCTTYAGFVHSSPSLINFPHVNEELFKDCNPMGDEFILEDGSVAHGCIWVNGMIDTDETALYITSQTRKRKWKEVADDHDASEHLLPVPLCPLCHEYMMHSTRTYVYNECGHRVCGDCHDNDPSLASNWKTRCVM